jgi:hypothetical protein
MNNDITVFRMHPDKCGGFAPMGTFAFRFTYLALAIGVFISAAVVQHAIDNSLDWRFTSMVFVYAVVVPSHFYLLMWFPHKKMVFFRDDLINKSSKLYSSIHAEALGSLPDSAMVDIEAKAKQMDALQGVSFHARQYPVWPFSTRIQFSVLLNAVSPLLITVVSIGIERLLN